MRTRLIIVALFAFALGACVDRFVRITGYDHVIATMQQRLATQQALIQELQAERAEIQAVLRTEECH